MKHHLTIALEAGGEIQFAESHFLTQLILTTSTATRHIPARTITLHLYRHEIEALIQALTAEAKALPEMQHPPSADRQIWLDTDKS